jgi:hypothetical protein
MSLPIVGLLLLRVLAGRLRSDDHADAAKQRLENERRASALASSV